MAIEPAFPNMPSPLADDMEDVVEDEGVSISIENPDSVIVETEDGGMLIDFNPDAMTGLDVGFDANLAEYMDDRELGRLASELVGLARSDLDSRKDWRSQAAWHEDRRSLYPVAGGLWRAASGSCRGCCQIPGADDY
jgi:hypothetical protein